MRSAFVDELMQLASDDERVFLLTADLGWSVLERFAERFPDRFLNVGVAEQNMIGIATGLALLGYVPFVYSIATFASMRAYEQVRNGPILHRLPVRIVGIGGGYSYGHAGPTHYALEDLSLARTQPGLTTIAPADPDQTRAVVRATRNIDGPVYLRVGKGGNPPVPGLEGRFALGKPEVLVEGGSILFLCTGEIVTAALGAAEALARTGQPSSVAVLAHLPYQGTPALIDLLARHPAVISVEEGFTAGGLGALVAQTIACAGLRCRLGMLGVSAPLEGRSGGAAYMRRLHGLDAPALAEQARRLLESSNA